MATVCGVVGEFCVLPIGAIHQSAFLLNGTEAVFQSAR
jgi:hypothetical protein